MRWMEEMFVLSIGRGIENKAKVKALVTIHAEIHKKLINFLGSQHEREEENFLRR